MAVVLPNGCYYYPPDHYPWPGNNFWSTFGPHCFNNRRGHGAPTTTFMEFIANNGGLTGSGVVQTLWFRNACKTYVDDEPDVPLEFRWFELTFVGLGVTKKGITCTYRLKMHPDMAKHVSDQDQGTLIRDLVMSIDDLIMPDIEPDIQPVGADRHRKVVELKFAANKDTMAAVRRNQVVNLPLLHWSRPAHRHGLGTPEQRKCVQTTLFIAARLRRTLRLPSMPDDLWVLILGFLKRNHLGKC